MVAFRMVSVDGVARRSDVEPGPAALARERSSDSLDFAPDGSGRPAESSSPGALGRDEDDDLAVAEVVEDLVRERSASARRGRASKSKTGANATPARARANAPPPPRARPRAEPKPRPAVNISPSVFRPPIRVVHASRGEPRGDHDDDANDDPRAANLAEDGVGIGIGIGNDVSVEKESSPGGAARRRRRALPPSRILDARAIMDACAASRPSECFRANLTGRHLAAVDAEELRYLSSHVSRLRVCDNDLEGEDVAALASLASLRVLDASANAARVIPAETFALRRALEPELADDLADDLAELPAPPPPPPFASLARLDLSFNALDHRCLATLSTLAALERLNLSDNRVNELPTSLFARNDEDARRAFEDGLDADAGAYRDGAFVPFPSLRRLRLSRQTPRLASRRCDWVATLARLPRLARLSLDGNALDGVRAGSSPASRAFRPGTDFPRLTALDLAGNPLRRVDALAALTTLAATTRRRNPRMKRERIRTRTDGVCEDDSGSDGSEDDSEDDSGIGGRLEEIRIFDTPLGEALALEGDREGLRRAFGLHGDEDASAFGFGSTRSARARGRAEALASGALIATRRARFGEGDARDAVSAPLAGALVATLEPADADAKNLTLNRGTLARRVSGRGFVAVRDDARPRGDDDALRFAADDAATDAVTTRLDAFARAAKRRDLAASYAVARRNDDAARRRAIREAEKRADEPRVGRVVERVAGTRSESSSVAERRAPAPPPSSRDEFEFEEDEREDERFERFGGDGDDDGGFSRSARLERQLRPGDAYDEHDEYEHDGYADESRANGASGRARAMLELRRALRPRATPREDGNRSSAYARPTAATAAKTKPTARLTLARRRVHAEGGARVRTVEEILRDLD